MPYGNITDPETVAKIDSCVKKVMAQGHDKSSAIAICIKSIVGDKKEATKESFETSVMVALVIPMDVGKELLASVSSALPDNSEVIPLNQLHITLAHLGDISEIGKSKELVYGILKNFADAHGSVVGKISGIGLFSLDAKQSCLYASFDSPALSDFRTELVNALEGAGIVVDKEHGFVPHISLAYLSSESDIASFQVPSLPNTFGDTPIVFRDVTLAWGTEWMPTVLGGTNKQHWYYRMI